ncbi:hypothetical protein V5D56_16100 [Cellulosimicrobium sp. PMB13]|uniref:hypothetical protein n=1 Tax=Cellulosimicrobium sp. PMB13 TaxID=3120158 RepID=UPI003F4C3B08
MRTAGEASWRLSVSDGGALDEALWLRDALSLDLSLDRSVDDAADDVPPRVLGAAPDRSELVPVAERAAVATRWLAWWRDLVRLEVADRLAEAPSGPDAFLAWAGARHDERQVLGTPPEYDGLGDVPPLQRAAVLLHPEARERLDRRERTAGPRQAAPQYAVTARDVVAAVASERRVSPGALRGAVLVLDVDGPWWRAVAPGAVACSADVLDDASRAEGVLRVAFESGLGV